MLKELDDNKNKYRPTEEDIKKWFNILNEQIFGNKLSYFDKVHIGRPRNVHALFHYWIGDKDKDNKLTISQVFENEKKFVEILAHEMIHLYQHTFDEPLGHGPSFLVWRDILNLRGLSLYKAS